MMEIVGEDGLTFGPVHLEPPVEGVAEGEFRDDVDFFVASEVQILLHHIAEVLLRLYLSHEGRPECPWVELSAVRAPGKFKEMVRRRVQAELDSPLLAEVVYGTKDEDQIARMPIHGKADEALRSVTRLLQEAAGRFLAGGGLYNAAKHGLVIAPGRFELKVQLDAEPDLDLNPDLDLGLDTAGPTIDYLEFLGREHGSEKWRHRTEWVDIEKDLTLAYLWTMLIQSIWSVGRWRYVGHPTFGVFAVSSKQLDVVLDRTESLVRTFDRNFRRPVS